ncbi:MAG: tRNA pseudouridine(38-40) synthase TruA [Myxococcales bacterium]|nr:tRNA pseudouridine(38-40) synthase TruA [Myxococcales bacterium]MDH3484211.1 tRNA pseudouridine(38-40) synthase TruA [Myxococcales bacterium]
MGKEKLQFPHGVCLCLGYDGTDFHGWQAQPGLRTVQGMIEEAIDEMGLEHSPVKGCSRTDAGVHALGQVASFSCTHDIPREGWVLGLNARLPDDIVIHDAQPCFRRYNPRFHAAHKRYRYLVRVGRHRDPLLRKRAWQLGPKDGRRDVSPDGDFVEDYLDVSAIREAAKHFLGTHDFRAFRQSGDQREIVERTMFAIRVLPGWNARRDVLAIEVIGNSFLKNMVRIMAGTLVEVGQGRIAPGDISGMLHAEADRTSAGQTAPSHALTLVEIELARFDGPSDAFDRPTVGEPPRRNAV